MEVEVVRSARRRKTVQAREIGGVLRLHIPAAMSPAEEEHWVSEMTRRFARRRATGRVDLAQRAEVLATRYRLPHPGSIRWVDNQELRWGSCTPGQGTIRISSRLAAFPDWVLDYVIVHELAHLVQGGHGRRFWALVAHYPRAERARGYLMAKGVDDVDDDPEAGAGHASEEATAPRPVRPAGRAGRRSPAGSGLQTLW